ncbi:MAG: hypothetical protein ACSLE9_15100 [Burkholderiaceae bacterium]
MNATEWETLIAARDALLRAGHGTKADVTAAAAATLNCSVATLYRKLEDAGLETGRKRRRDAGETAMSGEDLARVGGMLFHSRRDNDKQLLTVEDTLDILAANGAISAKLSPGRVGQLLRVHHLSAEQLAQQRPAVELRSLHPNHVWQLDSSTCVLYYMKSGHLATMDRDEFYRNKPQNFARVLHDLCTRYAVSDHASGAFKLRYFLGGESARNLVDFWLYAVTKQPTSPMHGVPLMVMLDLGSGNTSHLFMNLARRMQVRVSHHAQGNARVSGQIEKTHDLIERHFEGRFRFMPAEQLTLDSINLQGEQWAATFCATRRHSRHGQPRYSVWMRITAEQLRVPAAIEVLQELVTSEPETRRVDNRRRISYSVKSFGLQTYELDHVPGATVGSKVLVAVNAYRAPAIDVRVVDAETGEEMWQTVEPIKRDALGFSEGATTIGEAYRTAANTEIEEQRNRITQEAYRKPGAGLPTIDEAKQARKRHEQAYAGMVDAMADVRATPMPSYLPRQGTAMDAPVRTVLATVLTVVEACKRLRGELGDAYSPQVYAWVAAKFPDGVPEDRLASICAQFTQTAAAPPDQATGTDGLRVVGGQP